MRDMAVSIAEELNGYTVGSSHTVEFFCNRVEIVRKTKSNIQVAYSMSLRLLQDMLNSEERLKDVKDRIRWNLQVAELEVTLRRAGEW